MSDFFEAVISGDRLVFGLDTGLWQNLITEAGGVIVSVAFTVFVVDLLREKAEKARWLRAENRALSRLGNALENFSDENFSIRPGPRRSQDRISREADQLYRTISAWAQNSTLAFMLGGNREFTTLADLADTIQYAIFALLELLANSRNLEPDQFHSQYAKSIQSIFGRLVAAISRLSKNNLSKKEIDEIREQIKTDMRFIEFNNWEYQPVFAA